MISIERRKFDHTYFEDKVSCQEQDCGARWSYRVGTAIHYCERHAHELMRAFEAALFEPSDPLDYAVAALRAAQAAQTPEERTKMVKLALIHASDDDTVPA